MEIKNKKEFQSLIRRYETISFTEIEDLWKSMDPEFGHEVARHLTGFGGSSTCSLCQPLLNNRLFPDCKHCMYKYSYGCVSDDARETYTKIEKSRNPETLLMAFRNRALFMKKML